jgi:hypothetical protein
MEFNPILPLPGFGPSEIEVEISKIAVPYASYTNTQNPNYLRAGTHWTHSYKSTPSFSARADGYAVRLHKAAVELLSIPSDTRPSGYTANGRFELFLGDRYWTGSLLKDERGPVWDAVKALNSLARDLKRGVPSGKNSV